MQFFLKAKHWQLFLLLFGLPFVAQVLFVLALTSGGQNSPLFVRFFPALLILYMWPFFGWLWAVGVGLHDKLPKEVQAQMNVKRFKVFLLVPAVYILFISLVFVFGAEETLFINLAALIVPLHLFSLFAIISSFVFCAKTLKAVELQRPVKFEDFVGEVVLFWFWILGVWFLQPRINRIAEGTQVPDDILL